MFKNDSRHMPLETGGKRKETNICENICDLWDALEHASTSVLPSPIPAEKGGKEKKELMFPVF